MVHTAATLHASLDELARREPGFAKVLEALGHPEVRQSEPGAATLMRTIVGQQVSVAAARSMWAKLENGYGSPPDLAAVLAASDEELRQAGLSRQKAGYARSLAGLVLSGELDLDGLDLPERDLELLLSVDPEVWSQEAALMPEYFAKFGDRLPAAITAEHAALVERLEAARGGS